MTAIEYDNAMEAIYEGKAITKETYEKLSLLAAQCGANAKHLMKQGRKTEAWWFKDNRSEIRQALARALVLEPECESI